MSLIAFCRMAVLNEPPMNTTIEQTDCRSIEMISMLVVRGNRAYTVPR